MLEVIVLRFVLASGSLSSTVTVLRKFGAVSIAMTATRDVGWRFAVGFQRFGPMGFENLKSQIPDAVWLHESTPDVFKLPTSDPLQRRLHLQKLGSLLSAHSRGAEACNFGSPQMRHRIPVFYVPEMIGKPVGTYSPSAGKPAEVVNGWLADGRIADRIEVVEFDSISRDTIAQVHDPKYVADVLALRADNGFDERSRSVADSLPFTSGSMLAAAMHVLGEPGDWDARSRIACSPSSGFHHAHFGFGHGFCTFNGLMVAAVELRRRRLIDRLLILDCDQHFGDGTQDIIERLGLNWITHITHGGRLEGSYANKTQMMRMIGRHMPDFGGPRSLVLYQAGADCHVDDPLGGFLTTEDMRERDRLVFSLAAKHRIPLAWNLAGGYQRLRNDPEDISPVLALHRNTMHEAIAVVEGVNAFVVSDDALPDVEALVAQFDAQNVTATGSRSCWEVTVRGDCPDELLRRLVKLRVDA